MEKGDMAVIVTGKARWVEGTEVEILHVSKGDDPKPVYARQKDGNVCAWLALEDLRKDFEHERNIV